MHALHIFLIFPLLAYLGRNADGSEIINGKKVENSMPYMVSVRNANQHTCGGFLIRDNFVLTAAHCDDEQKVTHVALGANNLKDNNLEEILIDKKFKPKSYEAVGKGSDIMLLKLRTKVTLGDKVNTIRLSTTEMKPKDKCQVAGWGANETGGHAVDDLSVVDVSIIDLKNCKGIWTDLPDNVICAGGDTPKGFCQGDSGGPLVCNGVAAGVVSFNNNGNCNYPDVPNVYTDVSKYLTWIDETIKANV